jgi:hypothetical protein
VKLSKLYLLKAVLLLVFFISYPISASFCSPKTLQPPAQKFVNYNFPVRSYDETKIRQWKVYIEKPLFEHDAHLALTALYRLDQKLGEAMKALPLSSHKDFTHLNFFLMYGPESINGGRNNGLEFFPDRAPDYHPLLDPRWRNCIVVYSARNYIAISEFWALKALVHELSHAHHLLHWPENMPELYNCWQNAMRLNLYHNVQDTNGHNVEKAWACTNQLEYFAELSCMYFIGCNYYPFNRQQLQSYNPTGYALIQQMWLKPKQAKAQ